MCSDAQSSGSRQTRSARRFKRSLVRSCARKDRYLESVKAHFPRLQGYRAFPTDADFEEKLKSFDACHFKRRAYLFRTLENAGRKGPVPADEYTLEHILPQNDDLRVEWRDGLGPDWQDIQAKYLHSLGNLTLTGYNSEYSDRPFAEKRDITGGLHESPLRPNRGLRSLDLWNDEHRIRAHYVRMPDLEEAWVAAQGATGGAGKFVRKYAAFTLLVIDEWLLDRPTESMRGMLLELMERRYGETSTVFCTQYQQ
jgi:hypothetical protein